MIQIDSNAYEELLGNINEHAQSFSAKCMSQCTGCKCSCKCACRSSITSDFDWEEV